MTVPYDYAIADLATSLVKSPYWKTLEKLESYSKHFRVRKEIMLAQARGEVDVETEGPEN